MVARSASLLCLAFIVSGCGGQPLEPWHTADLKNEFTVSKAEDVQSFADYLALEERLFTELHDKVYDEVGTGPEFALLRYSAGSASDPETRSPNFNRSFELAATQARGAVLLLHGMSDSPYSLHTLAESLNKDGYWVVGLRLPGHGTAPSALRRIRWEDMAAAAELAMGHLVNEVGDVPIHIVGYSMGSALALNYALNSIEDQSLAKPASLILISPAIGITRAAALAGPKATLGRVPGLGRLSFTAIDPEFDPYKYNSFATNAGSQVHRLTRHIASRIASLERAGNGDAMPPILVFKSTVDATVSVDAVVDNLLSRLPDNGNELVLFDINRWAVKSVLIVSDPGPHTDRLIRDDTLPFGITLIANEGPESQNVVRSHKAAFSGAPKRSEDIGLSWPPGVISLSHIALPFAPDDALYGRFPPDGEQLFLGQVEIRGERGLLKISTNWLLRLRYNPFYEVLQARVLSWLGSES